MSLQQKVKEVERVFADLEKEMDRLRQSTGLYCVAGCGRCCFKSDIEASVLELLPYALHLIRTGRIEEAYDELKKNTSRQCSFLRPAPGSTTQGSCLQYQYRGLICRLFGYAASKGMDGQAKLVTCQTIKTGQAETVARVEAGLKEDRNTVPYMSDYYFRMRSIDPDLGTRLLPINQAMLKAMEEVMGYYAYRELEEE